MNTARIVVLVIALGAGGVALLLPIGLALGVALTTAFGGSDGLHALAQVFSGPSTPATGGQPSAPGLESAREVPAIPLPHRARHLSPVTTPAAGRGAPSARVPASSVPVSTGRPIRQPSTGSGGTPTGGGSHPAPAPQPSPQPAPPQHSAVHNTGQQAADTVKTLPAPAGPVAGSAVQTVVDLIP